MEEKNNVVCVSPRNCFKEGFRAGMINYEEIWLKLVDLRSDSAHAYGESLAEKVYELLPNVLEALKKLLQNLGRP